MYSSGRKLTVLLLALAMLFSMSVPAYAESGADTLAIDPASNAAAKTLEPLEGLDWTVALYICGSNLESGSGSATSDIIEMLQADLPDNAAVIVMTGGASAWDPHDEAAQAVEDGLIAQGAYLKPDAEHTQLYRVDDDKMTLLYTYQDYLNMGDAATAAEFMEFVLAYAPAEHMMFSFWDHGGGPIFGAEQDEVADNDIMPLKDISSVLSAGAAARGRKIDVVGFDCCLMSSIEIANQLAPSADYLLDSEETEPGTGWNYRFLSVLSEKKNATAQDLGRRCIDLYPMEDTWEDTVSLTLALVDLSKLPAAVQAVEAMGKELVAALDDPETYALVARIAADTPSMMAGSYGLSDLYLLAHALEDVLPSAKSVVRALGTPPSGLIGAAAGNGAVVYRGVSPNYGNNLGMSIYYPLVATNIGKTPESVETVLEIYRGISMSDSYSDYVDAITRKADQLQVFKGQLMVGVREDGYSYMYVADPADLISLQDVCLVRTMTRTAADGKESTYLLGNKAVEEDWENNVFAAPMEINWPSIGGVQCTYYTDDYYGMGTRYTIPVLMEGSTALSYMIAISLNEQDDVLFLDSIIDIDDEGMSSRSYPPEAGMSFSTVLLEDGADEPRFVSNSAITIAEKDFVEEYDSFSLTLKDSEMSGGTNVAYDNVFRVTDMKGNTFDSAPIRSFAPSDISEFVIDPIQDQIYTGEEVTPVPTVRFAGTAIFLDDQFTVEFENNVKIGTATVTVTYNDRELDVSGTLTQTFEIKALSDIYTDVNSDDWFFDAANALRILGLMGANGDRQYSPNEGTTRAMLMTMLYRLSGSPSVKTDAGFSDVEAGAWYANAVNWAAEAGITLGKGDGSFGVNDPLTRQDCAVMLYRMAKIYGLGFQGSWMFLLNYPDADDVAEYADEAMHWMTMNGIITGMPDGTLSPAAGCTRAQMAVMLFRFLGAL